MSTATDSIASPDLLQSALRVFLADRLPQASEDQLTLAAGVLAESGRRSVGMTPAQAHVESNRAAAQLRHIL